MDLSDIFTENWGIFFPTPTFSECTREGSFLSSSMHAVKIDEMLNNNPTASRQRPMRVDNREKGWKRRPDNIFFIATGFA